MTESLPDGVLLHEGEVVVRRSNLEAVDPLLHTARPPVLGERYWLEITPEMHQKLTFYAATIGVGSVQQASTALIEAHLDRDLDLIADVLRVSEKTS